MMLLALSTEWIVAGVAFLAAVGFLFAWLKTGRKELLIGVAIAVVGGAGTLAAASLIVTDKERVENEIRDVARDVEQNNVSAVLDHVHPEADEIIQEAKRRLPNYDFDGVLVRMREVDIDESATPRTAVARFIVTVSGAHRESNSPIPRGAKGYFEVELVEQGDRWLIRGYKLRNFIEAFQQSKRP